MVNPETSKLPTSAQALLHSRSYIFFLQILGTIEMIFKEFKQLIANISKLVLFLLWGLESSFGLFFDFDKIAMECDLLVFSEGVLFLIVSVYAFKSVKNHEHIITGFWLTVVGWQIPANFAKCFLNILPITKSISYLSFLTKYFTIEKVLKNMFYLVRWYSSWHQNFWSWWNGIKNVVRCAICTT